MVLPGFTTQTPYASLGSLVAMAIKSLRLRKSPVGQKPKVSFFNGWIELGVVVGYGELTLAVWRIRLSPCGGYQCHPTLRKCEPSDPSRKLIRGADDIRT